MGMRSEERGTLTLPSNAVLPLRNALTDAINAQRTAWFDLAKAIHAHLMSPVGRADKQALGHALRKDDANRWHQGAMHVIGGLIERRQGTKQSNTDGWDRLNAIEGLLLGPLTQTNRHLRAPRKKDLPQLPKAKTWKWGNSVCSITLDGASRELHWDVPETKNAVDDAWESLLGRTLKARLDKMAWTRGTGGVFRYSDEAMADAAMDFGGGGTSERGFGPIGERATDLALRGRRVRLR